MNFADFLTYFFLFILLTMLVFGGVVVNLVARSERKRSDTGTDSIILSPRVRHNRYLVYSTIGASLISLSALYQFLFFNSSDLGFLALMPAVTIIIGAFIGSKLQKKAVLRANSDPKFAMALDNGVVAAIFADFGSNHTANLARAIAIVSLAAILWLEIKAASIILTYLLTGNYPPSPLITALISVILMFGLAFFIFRFGMTGVVASDSIYWSLICISMIFLMIFTIHAALSADAPVELVFFPSPAPGTDWVALSAFLVNMLILNVCLFVTRDDHWTRVAAFRRRDHPEEENLAIKYLPRAAIIVGLVTIPLVFTGWQWESVSDAYLQKDTNATMMLEKVKKNTYNNRGSIVLANDARIRSSNEAREQSGDDALIKLFLFAESQPLLMPMIIVGMIVAMLSTANGLLYAVRRNLYLSVSNLEQRETRKNPSIVFKNASIFAASFGILTFMVLMFVGPQDAQVLVLLVSLPSILLPGIVALLTHRHIDLSDLLIPAIVYSCLTLIAVIEMQPLFYLLPAPVAVLCGVFFTTVKSLHLSRKKDLSHGLD